MPFRWKKNTRFSQLVADHLQSPKHGGSLVVETGFPTSLIDLYVRNRGRFRKSSSSAKRQKGNDSSIPFSDSFVDSNSLSFGDSDRTGRDEIIEEEVVGGGRNVEIDDSRKSEVEMAKISSDSLADSNSLSLGDSDRTASVGIIEEEVVGGGSDIEIDDSSKGKVEMAKLNPVIVAALKVLFVVVLILGTKRFKFGITVSAFLLFFLELVGKPLLERSNLIRPSLDPKTLVESKGNNGNKHIKDSKENNTTLFVCSEVVEIEEQVEDSKQEVRSEKELEESRSENLMEIRRKSSRRALMKSRMKKLVPKKLRKSSMGSKGEISMGSSGCCSESKLEMKSVSKQKQNKIVEIEIKGPCSSTKIDYRMKKLGKESGENYGCLVLCLIVLIGLIGGRVLALVLALSWCLIQKKSPTTMEKCKVSHLLI